MNEPSSSLDSGSEKHALRATWSGQLAFILACSASAIGLGNLWRFPYLAAQYGGGIFLLFYLILVVTLGFTIMLSEIALGRATKLSGVRAFGIASHKRYRPIGWFVTLVPFIIVPYYCVIGGWILKYLAAYAFQYKTGTAMDPAFGAGEFFSAFISHPWQPVLYGSVFIIACMLLVMRGLKNGIEASNKVMMPLLLLLALIISIYSITRPGAGAGLKYYLVPNFDLLKNPDGSFSFILFCKMLIGAMGQMFYSLSLAMGITITYGSYMRRSDSIEKSVRRIEIMDTAVAILAGLMIIPACFAFAPEGSTGQEIMSKSGPGLMFVALPQVFDAMSLPRITASLFFVLVLFAAATSAISLFETCVASIRDITGHKRMPACVIMLIYTLIVSIPSALCYSTGPLGGNFLLGKPFLDFSDFVSNNVMMPLAALLTCLYIGWVLGPKFIYREVTQMGAPFKAYAFYKIMLRFVAPLLITVILVTYTLSGLGFFKI